VREGEIRQQFGNNPDVSKALRLLADQGGCTASRAAGSSMCCRVVAGLGKTAAAVAKPHLALVSNPPLVAELCWSADFDLSASSADLLLFFPTPFPPRLLGS
jgi:hypothetical protein